MAVATTPKDFSAFNFKLSRNAKLAVFYVLVGFIAIAVAVPAGLMSAEIGLFEECYDAVACATQ